MDLGPHHLRMIEAIAATGSISKAAARLNLTQPAVSTMLRRVEGHLGVQLFVRSSEGVMPTPVGAEVATRARAALACIDDLNTALAQRLRDPATLPLLRIGVQACPALTRLSDHLDTLAPDARLQLRVDPGGGRIPALLASGALDIGLFQEPVGHTPPALEGLERLVLVECEPVLVGMSTTSPLAARPTVDLDELADQDWLDDPLDDGPWPAYFRAACAGAGFQPRVRYWSTDWQISSSLVRSGRAIGIYQPTAAPRDGVTFRRITGDPLGQRLVLVWRPDVEASAGRLRDIFNIEYMELVRAQRVYGDWWDEHPEAHPALPIATS
ncbi:LysR family transcriptional regulator [Actinomadura barringtoniae]|uniref:LysR family transcriptional regulator n=1 Tax=Actinomadura barringtoniae TaxID=1427535 RepID=A0A939PE61_9ACTN|nr:LysR family transcriptional regulator [Actinomadura barringtoniae]MBO2450960.1 LysR family transcriptional regulator [Actinomadura barringtoniae]